MGSIAAEGPWATPGINGASADVFLEALLEYSSDAISVGDRESRRFVLVSDSFCTLTGYAWRELIGQTSVEVGLIADDAVRAQMLSQTDSGIGSLYQLRLCRKDGTSCLVESSVLLLAGESMLTISRDITERRDAEVELERRAESGSRSRCSQPARPGPGAGDGGDPRLRAPVPGDDYAGAGRDLREH